jgi:hypothetical protein
MNKKELDTLEVTVPVEKYPLRWTETCPYCQTKIFLFLERKIVDATRPLICPACFKDTGIEVNVSSIIEGFQRTRPIERPPITIWEAFTSKLEELLKKIIPTGVEEERERRRKELRLLLFSFSVIIVLLIILIFKLKKR